MNYCIFNYLFTQQELNKLGCLDIVTRHYKKENIYYDTSGLN